MNVVKVQAPAKINLGLVVQGKRTDGYHEIETIMQMVSLYDEIVIRKSRRGIQVDTDHPNLPTGEENLVYQAADLLAREMNIVPSVRIRIHKRIPLGAGLGGGSSDAATTLAGLNRLWGLDLSRRRLMDLATRLGMDVPFFLFAPTALARGRGEILTRIPSPSPPLWVLLVDPGIPISTRSVYQGLKIGLTTKNKHISMRRFSVTAFEDAGICLENDLESVTFKKFPLLQEIKESLYDLGALFSLMSGSGSALFGIFPDRPAAHEALKVLKGEKNLSVSPVRTLTAITA